MKLIIVAVCDRGFNDAVKCPLWTVTPLQMALRRLFLNIKSISHGVLVKLHRVP